VSANGRAVIRAATSSGTSTSTTTTTSTCAYPPC
jgi:hypothetical protein